MLSLFLASKIFLIDLLTSNKAGISDIDVSIGFVPTLPNNNAIVINVIRVVMGLELEKLSCRDERH